MSKPEEDWLSYHKELRELREERDRMNDREEEIMCRMSNLSEDNHLNWRYIDQCLQEGLAG